MDNGTAYGEWLLSNSTNVAITSLVIDAIAGGIVFDNVLRSEETPGSNLGRFFTPDPDAVASGVVGTYSSPYPTGFDDLWGVLTLTWRDVTGAPVDFEGSELRFLADTDKIPVPGTVLLMLLGSLGFAARYRTAGVWNRK